MLRKPIVTIMGHVDHGKTRLLDTIRNTTVIDREAGMITQAIGASIVPIESMKRICGPLLQKIKFELTLKGLLFIDTPGHAAFTNLRRRGGNLADIAIIVVDINEGIMPQTKEAIEILKRYKTPFVVAANKIDLIHGWKKSKEFVLEDINVQSEDVIRLFDTKMYEIVGKLYELGFNSERFDRVEDYTAQIAIIPTNAKQGWGVPELLMVLSGLAQKYLNQCLDCNADGPGKGTILEVKEETGLGKTLDVIIYDGNIKANDTVVIGAIPEPIVTRIKALFEPAPLSEMRDKKSKFNSVKEATAAAGVKISAPDIDTVVAGMPLKVCRSTNAADIEACKQEIKQEIEEVLIETDKEGIVIKADSLGSLEAMITLLREKNLTIKRATVGPITKKDLVDAQCNIESEPLHCVVLGFNVEAAPDAAAFAEEHGIKVITHNVIYRLIEDYEKWVEGKKKNMEQKELNALVKPAKFEIMRGYVFRQNNPAVFGADISEGELKAGVETMKKDGTRLSTVRGIQQEQKTVESAKRGQQVAISMDNITMGRQLNEGDIVYVIIPEEDFRKLKELKKLLKNDEISLLKETAEIMRKNNPTWGI
jgi:translation initiation factor 5B